MARTPFFCTSFFPRVIPALALSALLEAPAAAQASYNFDTSEASFKAAYAAKPIALLGAVLDEAGEPVAGAQVTAIGWGTASANNGLSAVTGADGDFTLAGMTRNSVLLRVECPGYYTELVPADLQRPLGEPSSDAGVIVLSRQQTGRARLIVAGDTMFGRRFVDSDGDGIEGEPGDLIQPATRADDAKALFKFMRDVLSSADYTQVNLETQITSNTSTPHPYKSYVFFSYPETVGALPFAGVDAVNLANNHMYDYMELGLSDTLANVPSSGLDWFGAGMSLTAARGTVLYQTLGDGVDVTFQGFDQIVNDGTTLPQYSLVASDDPTKGGALELSTDNMSNFTLVQAGDRFIIPVVHGGVEYTDYPTSGMRWRFTQLIQQGAGVIVAHHPHYIHGIGLYDAGAGPRYIFMSLGNLLFDQDILETFNSYLAEIDVDQTGSGAYDVHRVQVVPFHIEGYVPKLVSGDWLARTGRHIGHLSTTLPAAPTPGAAPDGLHGAIVFPSGPRVVAVSDASSYQVSESVETQSLPLASQKTGLISFSRAGDADMLAKIQTSAAASCDYGREVAIYGDFEDLDVDDASHEATLWPASTSRHIESSVVRSGTGALVLLRKYNSTSSTSASMNNNISFTPGQSLTLSGYVKGNNAGQFRVQVYWYSSGGSTISSSYVYAKPAGTYDWTPFTIDLKPPSTASSLRFYFKADIPASGEAQTFVDDVSLARWEGTIADASTGSSLPTPNNWSFVRCTAAAAQPSLGVTLTHRSYALNAATP